MYLPQKVPLAGHLAERQFRRYRDRYEEEGLEGLVDRRLGKPSPKRVPAAAQLMRELYGGVYRGWDVKHFHEHLVRGLPVRGASGLSGETSARVPPPGP